MQVIGVGGVIPHHVSFERVGRRQDQLQPALANRMDQIDQFLGRLTVLASLTVVLRTISWPSARMTCTSKSRPSRCDLR